MVVTFLRVRGVLCMVNVGSPWWLSAEPAIHLRLFSRCRLSETSVSLFTPTDMMLTHRRAFVCTFVEMTALYFIAIYFLSKLFLGCGEKVSWYFDSWRTYSSVPQIIRKWIHPPWTALAQNPGTFWIFSFTSCSQLASSINTGFRQEYVLKYVFLQISYFFEVEYVLSLGHPVAQLVETLRYKPESRGFDCWWYHWNFSLT
jgi:hypothetical protein